MDGEAGGATPEAMSLGISVPGDEIGEQPQAGALALFRVELHGEDISPRYGASKRRRIRGGPGGQAGVGRAPGDSCARNRTARRLRCPTRADARRVCRTGLQPMCGTLSRSPDGSPCPRRETARTRPGSSAEAPASALPRWRRTASAARGRRRGTGGRAGIPATTSRKPARVEAAMESGIALCPGSTTRDAPRITSGSAVTTIDASGATCTSALQPSAGCPFRSRRPRCQASGIRSVSAIRRLGQSGDRHRDRVSGISSRLVAVEASVTDP